MEYSELISDTVKYSTEDWFQKTWRRRNWNRKETNSLHNHEKSEKKQNSQRSSLYFFVGGGKVYSSMQQRFKLAISTHPYLTLKQQRQRFRQWHRQRHRREHVILHPCYKLPNDLITSGYQFLGHTDTHIIPHSDKWLHTSDIVTLNDSIYGVEQPIPQDKIHPQGIKQDNVENIVVCTCQKKTLTETTGKCRNKY